jgi:hypothetical protein
MYAVTDVRPRGKATALAESQKTAKTWIDNIPNLDDMYSCKSYDELGKIVNAWIGGEDDEDATNNTGTTRTASTTRTTAAESSGSTPTSTTDDTPAKKYQNLDDAFADLEDDF